MMETKMIRCPKCSHEQKNRVECESCGLIFARYVRARDRQKEKEAGGSAGSKASGTGVRIFGNCRADAVHGWSDLLFCSAGRPGKVRATKGDLRRTDEPGDRPGCREEPAAVVVTEKTPAQEGSRSIEEARNATVSIETPWGAGSGFFINKNYIVTNRHVVQMDQEKLAELKAKVETGRKLIELEKQKLQDLRQKLGQLPEGPSRSQLALILETREAATG